MSGGATAWHVERDACMERWGDRLTRCATADERAEPSASGAEREPSATPTARREASAISIQNCGRAVSLSGRFKHAGLKADLKS